ncbi:MAG: thiamine pyrophosphate-dependent enzyme, partial [Chitinispirillaceae bacterium]|nr:thiamine pyrophosphate-dependent enzyme [Chitinispirillaceae bacterium]
GWKGERLFTYTDSTSEIKPQKVIETLYKVTNGEAIIATDVGQHQMWTAQYFIFKKPRRLLTSGGLGTMGFGLPAAMGAAMSYPKVPVILIAGDGSIQMNIQELATISNNNIPVKIVILNNGYLGMVRQWQDLFYNKRYSYTCLRGGKGCERDRCVGPSKCNKRYIPDFIELAKSYCIPAFRGTHPDEIEEILKKGINMEGPVLMEFFVSKEENVFPMVPAGRPIDEILEGS